MRLNPLVALMYLALPWGAWGRDPYQGVQIGAEFREKLGLARRADGSIAPRWIDGLIDSSDYPASARAAKAEGVTVVALTISPKGRVTRCEITQSSGFAALDDASCRIALARYR